MISDVLSESTAGLARADVCRADEAAAFRFRVQFYEPLAQAFPPAGPSSGGVRLSIVTPDVPDAERCGHLAFGAELCMRGRVFRVHPCARARTQAQPWCSLTVDDVTVFLSGARVDAHTVCAQPIAAAKAKGMPIRPSELNVTVVTPRAASLGSAEVRACVRAEGSTIVPSMPTVHASLAVASEKPGVGPSEPCPCSSPQGKIVIRDLVRLFNYRVEPVPELLLIDADPAVRTGTLACHACPVGQNDATTDPTTGFRCGRWPARLSPTAALRPGFEGSLPPLPKIPTRPCAIRPNPRVCGSRRSSLEP